jgi:hypothetical protein
MNCSWVIDEHDDDMIILSFESMAIEYYADFISVFNGTVEPQSLLYKSSVLTSENEIPPIVSLKSFPMIVNWVSDDGGEREGWAASFHIGFCDKFDGQMNLFTTRTLQDIPLITNFYTTDPSQKRKYRQGSVCTWDVHPGSGTYAGLYFNSFDLATGDKIIVKDLATKHFIVQYSGQNIPSPLFHAGGMIIEFTSSKSSNRAFGFNANMFFDECPDNIVTLSNSHGIITDGSSPNNPYKSGKNCNWLIKPSSGVVEGGFIQLDFSYIELNDGDNLIIYSSDTSDPSYIIASLIYDSRNPNGLMEQSTFQIFGPAVFIQFITSLGQPNRKGFQFEFNGTLINKLILVCSTKCLACGAGTYYVPQSNECVACPRSLATLIPGQLKCSICPEGTYWESTSSCPLCSPGYFNVNSTVCSPCELPYVALDYGFSECKYCPNDYIPLNSSFCKQCDEGYTSTKGDSHCRVYVHNDEYTVVIYVVVGIGLLIIGAIVFVFYTKRKRSDPWDDIY